MPTKTKVYWARYSCMVAAEGAVAAVAQEVLAER